MQKNKFEATKELVSGFLRLREEVARERESCFLPFSLELIERRVRACIDEGIDLSEEEVVEFSKRIFNQNDALGFAKKNGEKFKFSVEMGEDLFGHKFLQFFSNGEKVLDIVESEGEWRMFVKPDKKPLKLAEMIKSCGDFKLEQIIIGEIEKPSAEIVKLCNKLQEKNLFS